MNKDADIVREYLDELRARTAEAERASIQASVRRVMARWGMPDPDFSAYLAARAGWELASEEQPGAPQDDRGRRPAPGAGRGDPAAPQQGPQAP